MTPKTILVTGCAGFIGSNFVGQFKGQFPKTKIIGIDDFSTGRRDAVHPKLVLYEGSILNEKLLDKLFKKEIRVSKYIKELEIYFGYVIEQLNIVIVKINDLNAKLKTF